MESMSESVSEFTIGKLDAILRNMKKNLKDVKCGSVSARLRSDDTLIVDIDICEWKKDLNYLNNIVERVIEYFSIQEVPEIIIDGDSRIILEYKEQRIAIRISKWN